MVESENVGYELLGVTSIIGHNFWQMGLRKCRSFKMSDLKIWIKVIELICGVVRSI